MARVSGPNSVAHPLVLWLLRQVCCLVLVRPRDLEQYEDKTHRQCIHRGRGDVGGEDTRQLPALPRP